MGWFGPWLSVTPFASLDCFGAGALLAVAQRHANEGNPRPGRILCAVGILVGVPLFILAIGWHFPPRAIGRLGLMNLAMTLLFMPLIFRAAAGFTGVVGVILTQRPILYIGKISYGIYVYHIPVQWVLNSKESKWLSLVPRAIPHAAIFLLATLTLAAISWHFFERPINQLKRLFPYRRGLIAS